MDPCKKELNDEVCIVKSDISTAEDNTVMVDSNVAPKEDEKKEVIVETKNDIATEETFYMSTSSEGAGLTSSTINMINTIIGAGMLSLPSTVSKAGIVGALLLLIVSLVLSLIGAHFLSMASIYTKEDSYGFIGKKLVNKPVGIVADISMIVFDLGIAVAYCNIVFNQTVDLAASWTKTSIEAMKGNMWWMAIIECAIFFFPILCLPTIDSLKVTSSFAIVSITLFVVISIFMGIQQAFHGGLSYVYFPKKIDDFTYSVSVFLTCLCSHVNIPKMTSELRLPEKTHFSNKLKKMDRVNNISFTTCVVIYYAVGLCGYLAFGAEIKGNMLDNFATRNVWYLNIVKLAYAFVALFSYPVLSFSPLAALDKMLFTQPRPLHRRCIEAFIWSVICLLIALAVPELNVIFALTGSMCGVVLIFVWPPLYYAYIAKKEKAKALTSRVPMFHIGKGMVIFAWVIFYVGIVLAIFMTSLEVKNFIVKLRS